ncbi:hypothetical protein BCAR13_780056 [Paraburkholderia caribensis]|nr:hypothetical protein BCAR13_780056 [Paraburkholderia caribensis]
MAVVARSALIPSPGDWWRDFLLFAFGFGLSSTMGSVVAGAFAGLLLLALLLSLASANC